LIIWISGNTGSGKTYLAKELNELTSNDLIELDGNAMREIWTDLGLSKNDRWENNKRTARLAKLLSDQGYNVVVSMIAPYKDLRKVIDDICHPTWIYMPSTSRFDKPYENPEPRHEVL